MKLSTGSRWRSRACTTEAIVVRADGSEVDLRCGGHPMTASSDSEGGEAATLDPAFAAGAALGKRYELEAIGLELLVTKAGDGSLSVGDTPLVVKAARRLPSSD